MWFELSASGIDIKLRIQGYEFSDKYDDCYGWCKCDFAYSSGDWLNYHKENKQILLACEIDEQKISPNS